MYIENLLKIRKKMISSLSQGILVWFGKIPLMHPKSTGSNGWMKRILPPCLWMAITRIFQDYLSIQSKNFMEEKHNKFLILSGIWCEVKSSRWVTRKFSPLMEPNLMTKFIAERKLVGGKRSYPLIKKFSMPWKI